jgi:hypothetical protein
MPLSTIVYLLVNVAYFVVLSKEELLSSNTVAVVSLKEGLGGSGRSLLHW